VQHDIAVQDDKQSVPPATISDQPKRLQVRGKLAIAIHRMLELGEPYNDAAKNAGLTTRAIRKALDKPHVLAYLRQHKQVFREAASAGNIRRLTQIRDAADNMPAVQAIKVLEQLGDEQQQRNPSPSASPGVVIRVVTNVIAAPASTRTIDAHADNASNVSNLQESRIDDRSAHSDRDDDAGV
jgi:hypothetical protein